MKRQCLRALLFCGSEKAALINTGMNAPDARKIVEGLTDLLDKLISGANEIKAGKVEGKEENM